MERYELLDADSLAAVQQALYSDAPQQDKRVLAPIFRGGIDGTRIFYTGDSRAYQQAGAGFINVDGSLTSAAIAACPALIGKDVKIYNLGSNGQTWTNFLSDLAWLDALIAPEAKPVVLSLHQTNDLRQNGAIAGTSYGDAAQLAVANAIRATYIPFVQGRLAANPSCRFLFLSGFAHTPTSSYFLNGVAGQNVMDLYRLIFRGDEALGLPPLDDYVNAFVGRQVALMVDTLRHVDGDTAYPYRATVNADGLHQTTQGMYRALFPVLDILNGPSSEALSSLSAIEDAVWVERTKAHTGLRPIKANMIKRGGSFTPIFNFGTQGFGSNYFDIVMRPMIGNAGAVADVAFGATTGGSYGATTVPQILPGDVMVIRRNDGTDLIMTIKNPPLANQGSGVLRWSGSTPANSSPTGGAWPTSADGGYGTVYRPKYAYSSVARRQEAANAMAVGSGYKYAYTGALFNNVYGGFTFRQSLDQSAHVLTTDDAITFAGGDDSAIGIPLTGATLTPGAAPRTTAVTINNLNWSRAEAQAAIIFSNT